MPAASVPQYLTLSPRLGRELFQHPHFSRFCEPEASLPAKQGNNTKQNKSQLHEVSGVVTLFQACCPPCDQTNQPTPFHSIPPKVNLRVRDVPQAAELNSLPPPLQNFVSIASPSRHHTHSASRQRGRVTLKIIYEP